MKTLIFLVIYGFATQLRADDLLTGYSLLISSASTQAQLELNVKPSFERAPIKDKYKTLVFVFMNGVNDLGILNYSLSDINEMEMFGSTDDMAVVAEHNAILSDSQGFIRFSKGASTYFIEKDTSPTVISRVISYTPDGDMGSARHLAISAKKVLKRFKPDRFIMIVWNHGNGYFGIAYDDVSGNSMSVKDLSYALSEIREAYGRKIDVFAMDACLMQMAEVVAEIKDYASFIVASQELVPGPGYPYDDVLKAISMTSSAKDAAIGIVDAYYNAYSSDKSSIFEEYFDKDITLSVIDTSKYLNFISLLNRWVMLATKSSDFQVITSSSVKENIFFFHRTRSEIDGLMTRSADLVDYLEMARSRMKDESLKGETSGLIDFVKNKLVIYHKAGDFQNFQGFSYSDRTNGIAIYLPKLRYNSQIYEGLRFCEESLWDEFLKGDLSDELNPSLYSYHIGIDVEGKDEEDKVIEDERKTLRVVSGVDKKNLSVLEKEDKADNIASLKTLDNEKQRERKLLDKSDYPNIYSTSYTTTKTLVPTKESLLELSGIEKSKLLKGSLDKTAKKKEQIPSDTSLLLKNVVEKSKETAKILLASVSDEAKRIKDVFFEDKNEKDRYLDILNKFEVEITTNMSVEFSKKLFDDPKLQKNLIKVDRNRASKLISYSASIIELDRMLSKDYSDGDVNVLSSYLSSTLDRSSQICELGICVPPENLVEKMMRKNAGRYDLSKITFTEKAIRKWEYIFSDEAYFFEWGQARGVKVSSQTWLNMSVKERNASLSRIVSGQLRSGTTVLI
ncbi:MAG: clostripain-related cysteine peptidase, partial [Elusimicrobiales bacterium]